MRVPASMVVRMNSASNMMAKWYQYFISPATARGSLAQSSASLRTNDMPTASVTAPPVRPRSDSLPTSAPMCQIVLVRIDGQVDHVRAPLNSRSTWATAGRRLLRLVQADVDVVVEPRRQRRGRDQATIPTTPSISIAP